MYSIKGFELKNSLNDMTVKEFEKLSETLRNPNLEQIEKYIKVLEDLGMPDAIINELTDVELFEVIGAFNANEYDNTLIPSVEIKGYNYVAYTGDKFVLRAKDMSLIEKAIKNVPNYMSTILAVVFKREDLGPAEHYVPAHVVHKASLFADLNAGKMYAYLMHITDSLNSQIKKHVENAGNPEPTA